MLALLGELEAAKGHATFLYIPRNSPLSENEKTLKTTLGLDAEEVLPDIDRIIDRSKTGAVLFWGEEAKYLVLPPFPVKEKLFASGYDVEPLRSMLQHDLLIGLILVRLGAYAIGVFQGEKLMSSKVGTGPVHSRHSKGGSSARRFERHREKQIEYFFERVCRHVREHLEPHLHQIDYVFYGGERHTLLSFRKQCPFLEKLENRTVPWLLNVREPGRATLEAAISQVWSSEVIQWQENEPSVELR
jgi:peptide subunit release factor 1 (eRF1)